MKKAVIAVAVVVVFIFTLTQKSEAVTAAQWSTLSNYLNDGKDYYTSPIELSNNITSDDSFTAFTSTADKKITSAPGHSFSLTFDTAQFNVFLVDNKKLMFKNLNLLTFSNATASAIENRYSLITFDSLTANFSGNSAEDGGAIYSEKSTVSFVNSTLDFSANSVNEDGGAISNYYSIVSFVNSTVDFLDNKARDEEGGAIYNIKTTLSFVNSTVSFSSNSAENGGAIDNQGTVSFVNSTVSFSGNRTTNFGGAIYNNWGSTVSFVNSTVDFSNNSADHHGNYSSRGGAIYNDWGSPVSFVNSTVSFSGNSAEYGGAILNHASTVSFINSIVSFSGNRTTNYSGAISNSGTVIFKGRSSVIFEDNLAPQAKGADIYNDGIIEIAERSEVILRSGINGDANMGGVINIKSGGVLTISADEIGIGTLNVSAGSKFSLVDRQAIFATVYKTKTARIDKLTVAGILEIGIDLSANNINDQISAKSITFQKGSSLKIVPFNKWSSPKTYSIIFEGDLRGFENLDYDRSRFVLNYDNKTKTLSLRVISDPTL